MSAGDWSPEENNGSYELELSALVNAHQTLGTKLVSSVRAVYIQPLSHLSSPSAPKLVYLVLKNFTWSVFFFNLVFSKDLGSAAMHVDIQFSQHH